MKTFVVPPTAAVKDVITCPGLSFSVFPVIRERFVYYDVCMRRLGYRARRPSLSLTAIDRHMGKRYVNLRLTGSENT
jgi:hypothetical protein